MELMEALRNRRAVRDFKEEQIDRSTIEGLISAAILAPSSMNLQPWAFAAVPDRERIESYGARARAWLLENADDLGREARTLLERPGFSIFHHAPALVLVLATSSAAQAVEDCCLAAQNLTLAARDEGIGSCWIGFARPWLNLAPIKKELSLRGDYQVVAPIVLGYPKAWPATHGRKPPEIHGL